MKQSKLNPNINYMWTQKDLDALKECIETRWKIFAEHPNLFDNDRIPECQLCTLAQKRCDYAYENQCNNCIICVDTHMCWCAGTPYDSWFQADFNPFFLNQSNKADILVDKQECAEEMLEYLEDLYERMINLL